MPDLLARSLMLLRMKRLLMDRLIEFGGRACALARRSARDPAMDKVLRQLVRSATAPAANYAEAREAMSPRDYAYRMKICVKELRESLAWLQMAHHAEFKRKEIEPMIAECHELIAISVTCIRRATTR